MTPSVFQLSRPAREPLFHFNQFGRLMVSPDAVKSLVTGSQQADIGAATPVSNSIKRIVQMTEVPRPGDLASIRV